MKPSVSNQPEDRQALVTRIAELEREIDLWRGVAASLKSEGADEFDREAAAQQKRVSGMEAEVGRLWEQIRSFRLTTMG